VPVDVDYDDKVDYVYAGDLRGNMWKFDLRGNDANAWSFGFLNGTSPQPLVTVKNENGDLQPITSPVEVMLDCATTGDVRGLMVIFGTGQYLTTDDFVNIPVQSYYGIWDRAPIVEDADGLDASRAAYLGTFEADRSLSNMPSGVTLLEQVFEIQQGEWWALTEYQPDWYDAASGTGTHMGWYWDMPVANERNTNDPVLLKGHVVLISTVPSTSPCDSGGVSYINIVNACTGGRPTSAQFDVNLDSKITSSDTIVGPTGDPEFPSRHTEYKVFNTPLVVGDMMFPPDKSGAPPEGMPIAAIKAGMFFWRVIGQ
jgi:type IV pilus assembly protein PilY1